MIVIIGTGEIGLAIGSILQKKKEAVVKFWDRNPAKIANPKPLSEIIPLANFIFTCVPSWAMRQVATNILPRLKKETVIVSLAKGIEEKGGKTMDELLEEILPSNQHFALLAGPMLAEELKQDTVGIGVAASKNKEVFEKISNLFKATNLYLEYSDDIHGVALASVLKNIYAIALGIADGLKWGGNGKGWLAAKAVQEMAEIVEKLGGKRQTALGTAGLGDFIATGFSPYSRNRQFGNELIKKGGPPFKSEGSVSLPLLIARLKLSLDQFPLLKAISDIIREGQDGKTIFEKLIKEKTQK